MRFWLGAAFGLAAAGALGCGGKQFSAEETDGSGGSGASGGASIGGSGGTAASGGAAGSGAISSGGAAGDGGAAGAGGRDPGDAGVIDASEDSTGGCACNAGEYCAEGVCLACSELGRFEFGTPELVAIIDPGVEARKPRAFGDAGLVFVVGAPGDATRIWATDDLLGTPPAALDLTQLPNDAENGPLRVDGLAGLLPGDPSFFFDRQIDVGPLTDRQLMGASYDGSQFTGIVPLPSPLNADGFSDYGIAIAGERLRAWWTTTRFGAPVLVTVTSSGAPQTLAVEVAAPGGGKCAWLPDADPTPWVTPSGKLMLVSGPPVDDACEPFPPGDSDVFAVPLSSSTGLPSGPASPLGAVNTFGEAEVDPSLSNDLCWLYFASTMGTAPKVTRLFRAPRG